MSNICVGIRARPLLEGEVDEVHSSVRDNHIITIGHRSHSTYDFDYVFDEDIDNKTIFTKLAAPIVEDVTRGINGTIFAYGQTSSGKTHTMMGSLELGIIPLCILKLYEFIEMQSDRLYLIRVSYMEIYNETLIDLQDTSKKDLKIREKDDKVFVQNITETICTTIDEVLHLLIRAKDNRTIGETLMNPQSSRSHTIFTLTVESRETGDESLIRVSHLHLVDLAGSERASATGASGQRFEEGKSINQSLLTLGIVISKLSTGDCHIPYRESMLTRFLSSSLGGNSKTAIICTISPTSLEETKSTLNFAQRAKTIKNKPTVNEVFQSQDAMLRKIKLLEKENDILKKELEELKACNSPPPSTFGTSILPLRTPTFVSCEKTYLNSPLYKRDSEGFKTFIRSSREDRRRTMIVHRKTFLNKCDTSFDSVSTTPNSSIVYDRPVKTDVYTQTSGCLFMDMDQSFQCDHRRELTTATQELEQMLFNKDELDIKVSSLTDEIGVLKSSLAAAGEQYRLLVETNENEVSDMTKQLNTLKSSLATAEEQYGLLLETHENKMSEMTKQLNTLKTSLATTDREYKEIIEIHADLKESYQIEAKSKDNQLKKFEEDKALLENQILCLNKKFDSTSIDIERVISENSDLKQKLFEVSTELKEKHDQLESKSDPIKVCYSSLYKKLDETVKALIDFKMVTGHKEETREIPLLTELEKLNQELREENSTLRMEKINLQDKMTTLQEECDNLDQELKNLEKSYFEQEDKLQELDKELDEKEVEVEELRSQLSTITEDKTKLSKEHQLSVASFKKQIKQIQHESDQTCNTLQAKINDLENKLKHEGTAPSQGSDYGLQSEIDKLESMNKKLKQDYNLVTDHLDKVRIERDRYRQERNIFRAKYDHLKEQKEHLMTEDIKEDDTTLIEQASESPPIGSHPTLVSQQSPKLKRRSMLFQPIPKKTSTKPNFNEGKSLYECKPLTSFQPIPEASDLNPESTEIPEESPNQPHSPSQPLIKIDWDQSILDGGYSSMLSMLNPPNKERRRREDCKTQ